tara:strand:- start:9246 stop:9902 length:657 start_codon:yes stop_codon:yes gene_type:complete
VGKIKLIIIKIMITGICLHPKGIVSEINIEGRYRNDINLNTLSDLKKNKPSKYYADIQPQCIEETGFVDNDLNIFIYAWGEGKPGDENKHELPPPLDTNLYFGNIYVFACGVRGLKNLNKTTFKRIYKKSFKGFYSLGDEDSERSTDGDDSGSSLAGFIVNDESDTEESNYENSEDEDEDFEDDEEDDDSTMCSMSDESGDEEYEEDYSDNDDDKEDN